ncbi:hypothetical protein QJS04_geneDACA018799 [Acorus gramineus]|uniref:Uncharacterized protein n=1 Tax=Acorus gramineus TaxID=55184 RepID=A0AAV9BMK9_ACOGR|nr:hypothetical protein QJS04_geneDACA018799 [Acorus gramineus]
MKNTMKKLRSSTTDELALVKAAAWAWYMRGAGAEDDPSREFDLARERRPPQPTRFKLEAERASAATTTTSPSLASSSTGSLPPSPAHTDNSLLDAYEVEMITRQLDLFIASGNSVSYQSIKKKRDKNNKSYLSWSGRPLNGFWLRQAMGMCRPARGDVVEAKAPARSARAGGRAGPRANAI